MPTGMKLEVQTVEESSQETPEDISDMNTEEGSSEILARCVEATEESVEVVLGSSSSTATKLMAERSHPQDQNSIFRRPEAVRPRATRAPHPHPPHQPYLHNSGSYGYRHGEYPQGSRQYPAAPPHGSGSFDDQGAYPHPTPYYSPHGQYPPPRYSSEEVNVISPNHKTDPHYRPPITPRTRPVPPGQGQGYYQYPPTSPVSRPGGSSSAPPRLRNYAIRRGEGAYARAQRDAYNREEGSWSAYAPIPPPDARQSRSAVEQGRHYPPVVADSFDSEHYNRGPPLTPNHHGHPHPPPPPQSSDPHHQFYGGGGSWGSFDSASGQPPPPHFDDHRYYGFPPDSPYNSGGYPPPSYSPGPIYRSDSFPPTTPSGPYATAPSFSYSYDENDRMLHDYHPDGEDHHPHGKSPHRKHRSGKGTPVLSNTSGRNMVLPKAAEEIDFDVTDPPLEPIAPPSDEPVCDSLGDVNSYDVLCGRGGGTNSQVGNRRFRQLVQEFQPTYLMAKRKEKPLLARTIVLVIRKRGGRFLKKNEDSGELFEVGDLKAEAKTSQALREGLDVRATRSAATSLSDKKKKKKSSSGSGKSVHEDDSQADHLAESVGSKDRRPVAESPPNLPQLQPEEKKTDPPSPHEVQYRKRRRMRSTDQFFPDFCPPRAEIGRPGSPSLADEEDNDSLIMGSTPIRRNNSAREDETMRYDNETAPNLGCAGIALDLVTGAATSSFCLGPTRWSRR
jgi:hypothetical protein